MRCDFLYEEKQDEIAQNIRCIFYIENEEALMSRSGKENEMNRKNVKRLLLGTIAVVIVVKVVRDITKVKNQEKDAPMDAFDDFYKDEAALSYAEVKANHTSQKYRLEDKEQFFM